MKPPDGPCLRGVPNNFLSRNTGRFYFFKVMVFAGHPKHRDEIKLGKLRRQFFTGIDDRNYFENKIHRSREQRELVAGGYGKRIFFFQQIEIFADGFSQEASILQAQLRDQIFSVGLAEFFIANLFDKIFGTRKTIIKRLKRFFLLYVIQKERGEGAGIAKGYFLCFHKGAQIYSAAVKSYSVALTIFPFTKLPGSNFTFGKITSLSTSGESYSVRPMAWRPSIRSIKTGNVFPIFWVFNSNEISCCTAIISSILFSFIFAGMSSFIEKACVFSSWEY